MFKYFSFAVEPPRQRGMQTTANEKQSAISWQEFIWKYPAGMISFLELITINSGKPKKSNPCNPVNPCPIKSTQIKQHTDNRTRMTQIDTDESKFAFLPDGRRANDLKSLSGFWIGTYIDPTLSHKSSMTQINPDLFYPPEGMISFLQSTPLIGEKLKKIREIL